MKQYILRLLVVGTLCLAPWASVRAAEAYKNPLKFDTLEGVLGAALASLQNIIVIVAIITIVIGAIMYITSAGNDSRMTAAKGAITAALIGLVLGIAAPSFLKELAGALGWVNVDAAVAAAPTLISVAVKVLNFLLSIVGILAIIMLVVGGFTYLTSVGDESRAETGKKMVTYSIIGIVIALASLVIVRQVAKFF